MAGLKFWAQSHIQFGVRRGSSLTLEPILGKTAPCDAILQMKTFLPIIEGMGLEIVISGDQ